MLIFRYNRISGYKWVGWLFPVGYNRISGYKCVGRLFPVACVQVRRLRVAGWLWRPEFSCRLSEPESSCRLIEPAWCVCVCRCLRWACCTPRPSWCVCVCVCVRVQVLALGLLYTQALMVGNYQYLIQDMFHTTVLASCMALTDPAQVGPGQGGGGGQGAAPDPQPHYCLCLGGHDPVVPADPHPHFYQSGLQAAGLAGRQAGRQALCRATGGGGRGGRRSPKP